MLGSTESDKALGQALDDLGNFRDPGDAPDAHRSWLVELRARLLLSAMTVEARFTQELMAAAPELAPLLDEHLRDQEGELLAYLFMGDVAGWLHTATNSAPGRVGEVLAWLEARFTNGSFDERNLIDVGIIEMLPARPEGSRILAMLPAELRSRAQVAGLLEAP